MNSSPENLPPQDNNFQAIKPELEPFNNLLNLLLDEKSSANGLPQAETAEVGDIDVESEIENLTLQEAV